MSKRTDQFPSSLLRRRLIRAGLAAAALPAVARTARAATSWRVGHSAPADFPVHLRLLEAAGAIASGTHGQMELKVYPNGELGSPVGMLAQLRAGTLDAAMLPHQVIASDMPGAALPMVGFAFTGYEAVWRAMDGDMGALLRQQMKDRLGIVAAGRCWDLGFRQVTTAEKPVRCAADMAGLRLRLPPEADFITLFQDLNARPVGLPMKGLEKALGARALDGAEGVLPLVKAARLYLVQSRCALTNHVWEGQWLCIGARSWNSLPDGLKDIAMASFDDAARAQRKDYLAVVQAARVEAEQHAMSFNDVDAASFRTALRAAGYYKAWRERVGEAGWKTLETYADGLG